VQANIMLMSKLAGGIIARIVILPR